MQNMGNTNAIVFLLTHPVRGATADTKLTLTASKISTHAPRERCDLVDKNGKLVGKISTHAPRERCD